MDKLKKKLKALFEALEGKNAALSDLAAADDFDAEAVKAMEGEIEGIQAQVKAVQSQIENLEKTKAVSKFVADLGDDDAPAVKAVGRAGAPAEPKDHVAKEVHKVKAFTKWARNERISDNEFDNLLNPQVSKSHLQGRPDEAAALPGVLKAALLGKKVAAAMGYMSRADFMGTGGSSTGGLAALVDPDYLAELQKENYPEALLIDLVRVIPTTSGVLNMPVFTQSDGSQKFGFSSTWIEEGDQKPVKTVSTTNEQIVTHELAATMYVTERALSRSAIALEPFLNDLCNNELRYTISTAIATGNGSTQPLGLVNHTGIREVKRQLGGQVVYKDLTGVQYKVPREDRRMGSYIIEDSVEQALVETTDNDGRTLFSASMANGIFDRLVGRTFATATETPTIGNDGDVMFGNLRNYILLMEEDIVFERSPHERFSKNQVAFKCYAVVGGKSPIPKTFALLVSDESS